MLYLLRSVICNVKRYGFLCPGGITAFAESTLEALLLEQAAVLLPCKSFVSIVCKQEWAADNASLPVHVAYFDV